VKVKEGKLWVKIYMAKGPGSGGRSRWPTTWYTSTLLTYFPYTNLTTLCKFHVRFSWYTWPLSCWVSLLQLFTLYSANHGSKVFFPI
jgi:hypothetical protein